MPKGNDLADILGLSTELIWFSIASEVAAARWEDSVKIRNSPALEHIRAMSVGFCVQLEASYT